MAHEQTEETEEHHAALPPGKPAKEVLTRAVKATAVVVPHPTVGEP